jgi:hypothetical protein
VSGRGSARLRTHRREHPASPDRTPQRLGPRRVPARAARLRRPQVHAPTQRLRSPRVSSHLPPGAFSGVRDPPGGARCEEFPERHPGLAPVLQPGGRVPGGKCRPCTPAASGSEAQAVVNNLSKRWGWPGHVRGLTLCNGSGNWEENYEALYTAAAGTTFEQQRKQILSRTREQCEADVQRFGKQWKAWDAPPAEHICSPQHSR